MSHNWFSTKVYVSKRLSAGTFLFVTADINQVLITNDSLLESMFEWKKVMS